jgi:hypothetical protein
MLQDLTCILEQTNLLKLESHLLGYIHCMAKAGDARSVDSTSQDDRHQEHN